MSKRHRATLDIRPAPKLAPDARWFEVDCPHGVTRAIHLPGAGDLSTPQWALALIVQHELEEGCGCVADLYRRYGVPLYRAYGKPLPPLAALHRVMQERMAAAGAAQAVRV